MAKANSIDYRLAAATFTIDTGRALRARTVCINTHSKLLAEAETGVLGRSGVGRLHGIEELNDFLEATQS